MPGLDPRIHSALPLPLRSLLDVDPAPTAAQNTTVWNARMKFSGEITVKAPRAAVFNALKDAHFFASCVEGVQDLTEVDPTHYTAVLETRVAYMKFRFKVNVELARIQPPDEIEAKIEGSPLGVVG